MACTGMSPQTVTRHPPCALAIAIDTSALPCILIAPCHSKSWPGRVNHNVVWQSGGEKEQENGGGGAHRACWLTWQPVSARFHPDGLHQQIRPHFITSAQLQVQRPPAAAAAAAAAAAGCCGCGVGVLLLAVLWCAAGSDNLHAGGTSSHFMLWLREKFL